MKGLAKTAPLFRRKTPIRNNHSVNSGRTRLFLNRRTSDSGRISGMICNTKAIIDRTTANITEKLVNK